MQCKKPLLYPLFRSLVSLKNICGGYNAARGQFRILVVSILFLSAGVYICIVDMIDIHRQLIPSFRSHKIA